MLTQRTRRSAKTEELAHQALEQIEKNIRNANKPEVYLQFSLLEDFPLLMEPGTLCSECMQWNHTPGLFKKILMLPSLTVKPVIWEKWCDGACAYREPSQEPDDFRPGIALVVCYSPFQDLPQDNLRDKKTISMSLVYIPEHWILPSFMEAAYVVNRARDAKDSRGMMSLAWIHKRSPFYLDISFREYKQHLTIMPLTLPTEDRLRYCGYTEILSLPHPVTGNPHILGEPVKSALLESFVVANAQCSHSWEEVADRVPDIMTRHILVNQTQTFLAAIHQLLCSQYQALMTMVTAQTGPLVHLGMYSWGAQASLTWSFTQVIPALGYLEHTMLANPSFSARPTPLPQKE